MVADSDGSPEHQNSRGGNLNSLAQETTAAAKRFIEAIAADSPVDVGKEPPSGVEDAGVPRAMWVDAPENGVVVWQPLPFVVSHEEACARAGLPTTTPAVVTAHLRTGLSHYIRDASSPDVPMFMLCPMPSDDPLGPWARMVEGWRPLVRHGLHPFAEYEDGWGPVCIDEHVGDVVWLDHKRLLFRREPDAWTYDELRRLSQPVAPTPPAFWDALIR